MIKNGSAILAAAMALGMATAGAAIADEAADAAAKPPASSLADILQLSGITVSGYVAASYYHSNGYSTFHEFDVEHDTFQLDQAALTLAYQPKEGFGALINVAAGEDMRILHATEDAQDNTFDLIQGYVQYATGPLTVIAGKYVTLAGAEVIAPTGNTNFSRSLLFFAEPLTHTGVRATYAVNDTVSLIGGVNNGWNTTATSYGAKTGELGLAWTPNKLFSLAAQGYIGKEQAYDAQRALLDVVATYTATSVWTFVLSCDWGKQEQTAGLPDLDWNGLAGYVNYAFNDQWRASLRAEYLDDKDGFVSGTPQNLKEVTLTFGYDPVKTFELRLEARYDKSDHATFLRTLPPAVSVADNQTGIALQGVFKF